MDKFNTSLKYTLALDASWIKALFLAMQEIIHPSQKLFLGKNMLTLDIPSEQLEHSQNNVSFISRQISGIFRCLQADLEMIPGTHDGVCGAPRGVPSVMKGTRSD